MALYAAYGSNMNPALMRQRCPATPVAGSGWLRGWRLTFGGEDVGWDGSLTTIVESPGDPAAAVFCVLWDISPADERNLDSWEGADLGVYSKIRLRVQTIDIENSADGGGTSALAWLYVLQAYEGGLPSASYIGVIADAAEAAGAPADYVAELRGRPCRSISS